MSPGISLHESRGPFSARDDLLKPARLRSHDFHLTLPIVSAGITEGGLFNVGDVNANCGVKGHAVIVHASSGTRIGCCVLE